MSEEYLWDRSGEPEPEIVRLEKILCRFRYEPKSSRFIKIRPRRHRYGWALAAAAIFVIGAVVGIPLATRGKLTAWQQNGQNLRAGQWIKTGTKDGVTIDAAAIGEVVVEPRSRLRLLASGENQQRFDLLRGTIHALIWAPPGRFVVDTPSAKTVDLGCRYTLQISDNGEGLLNVETGWVAFEWQKRESFIPAGAACVTRPGKGPGTPWFDDASGVLKQAVREFDQTGDEQMLKVVLSSARDRDALTLWHLLSRTDGYQRGEVFDRFEHAVELPATVTREAIMAGNSEAMGAAWNALNLGSTEWWRDWKTKWR
jgi:hypothetical protein